MLLLDSQIILGPVVVISSPKDFSRECFLDRTVGSHDSPVETVSSHVSELLLRASFKTPDAKKTWFRFGQLIWFEETSWDSPQVSSTSNSSDSGEISLVTAAALRALLSCSFKDSSSKVEPKLTDGESWRETNGILWATKLGFCSSRLFPCC